MRNRLIFVLAVFGAVAGCVAAYFFGTTKASLPPVFDPPSNPYASGIYAQGIVESAQTSGANVNLYPEVAGTVKEILVAEGQVVHHGDPLVKIDDSIQKATAAQIESQAQASRTVLDELKAQPRKETLDVSEAQVQAAEAALKTAEDALNKQEAAYEMDAKAVSKDALDSAANAAAVARTNLEVAQKQRDLTKAGAWSYDVHNQEKQQNALQKAYAASQALLSKYTLRAANEGVVLSVNTIVGAYISPQGAYDSYTGGFDPVVVLGSPQSQLHVRVYIDEILVPRLPQQSKIKAQMSIRGSNVKVPLVFVRMQPLVSPKIELSNQRQERVDVRVLPLIFKIEKPAGLNLYPGELVDVYIGE
ncbi:MAG TPA: biotin/lipoyl-binding protein [Candidatus Methylomirabilis sp.]|nr:biotin/lipoyl-binding protein [Candidatus Methylomirabilis sp.]